MAQARFSELISTARLALHDLRDGSAAEEPQAAFRAATAASRAAGFIEGFAIGDPLGARLMVEEFEALILIAEPAQVALLDMRPRPAALLKEMAVVVERSPDLGAPLDEPPPSNPPLLGHDG